MHKPKHKSKKRGGGNEGWSDWVWSEEYQRYYRCRHGPGGELEYEWNEPDAAVAGGDEHTPRNQSDIDDITQGIDQLGTTTYETEDYTYTAISSSHSRHHEDSARGKGKGKGKGKQSLYPTSHGDTESGYSVSSPGSSETGEEAQYPTYHSNDYPYYQHAPVPGQDPTYDQSAASVPQDEHHGDHTTEQASYMGYYDMSNVTGEASSAYEACEPEQGDGASTPRGGETWSTSAVEDAEVLDPRYKVEPSHKFQPGEIFKVHWAEPQGSGNEYAASVSGRQEIENKFGTKFFVGFRRFIVVANDAGNSTCIPILTYGGKACKKRGVKADKHGIIHSRGQKARPLEREPDLGFRPVRVDMMEDEKLSKESRVNYSKLVTIEHNIKVFFIGSVVAQDWEIVSDAVNACWHKKVHHRRRHR